MTPTLTHGGATKQAVIAPAGRRSEQVPGATSGRFVLVHRGARDAYQLARALSDAGMLETLVTDLFWPRDRRWAQAIERVLPAPIRGLLLQRSERALPFNRIHLCAAVGVASLVCDKLPHIPMSLRRWMTRYADAALGRTAGTAARRRGAHLLSYSYYGFDAFNAYGKPAMLFQMHPHPATMRRILTQELEAHPDCADSLRQEWELSLPQADFDHLVRESAMASGYLVASSFTKRTLVENGVSADAVSVIPYGVDTSRFSPDSQRRSVPNRKLELLFVGRINQRKGVKYLLDALRLLNSSEVNLTVCGRVVDGLELFRTFEDRVTIRASVSSAELVRAYQAADLFVFPSVGEGFGQVLLEALACGLPILSTTRTAAPDLIQEGVEGFIVEPRSPTSIAERIAWALDNRSELAHMGEQARYCAERFTWDRFRTGVVAAATAFVNKQPSGALTGSPYV